MDGKKFLCAALISSASCLALQMPLEARQVQPQPSTERTANAQAALTDVRSTFVIGPDDQIVIHALDVPDISGKPQRVDPNGDIRVPMVGRVHAAGMTLVQLESELTKRLKVYLQEPDVAVTVTEFHSQPVSVIGAVNASGVHQLEGRKTLIEMLSKVGGITADAGPTIRITRRLEWGRIPLPEAANDATGQFSTAEIDVKSLLQARSPEKNIIIQPYDVISVPRAELVYVVGEVGKSGPLPLSGGHSISALEAVSTSGGVLRTAAPSRSKILRPIAGGQKRTEIDIDLTKIMHGKMNDMTLLPGDILVVPDSGGKRFTARIVEAAIQTGTFVATYGIIR